MYVGRGLWWELSLSPLSFFPHPPLPLSFFSLLPSPPPFFLPVGLSVSHPASLNSVNLVWLTVQENVVLTTWDVMFVCVCQSLYCSYWLIFDFLLSGRFTLVPCAMAGLAWSASIYQGQGGISSWLWWKIMMQRMRSESGNMIVVITCLPKGGESGSMEGRCQFPVGILPSRVMDGRDGRRHAVYGKRSKNQSDRTWGRNYISK